MITKISAVIDTSVIIAGLKSNNSNSGSSRVINYWQMDQFTMIMTESILEELVNKLLDYGFHSGLIENFTKGLYSKAKMTPECITSFLDKVDPNDNMLLGAAFSSKADYLVTLDRKHILPIKHFKGTQVLEPFPFTEEVDKYNAGILYRMQTMIN